MKREIFFASRKLLKLRPKPLVKFNRMKMPDTSRKQRPSQHAVAGADLKHAIIFARVRPRDYLS